ncbi:hypothetical protein Lxx01000 [Leifsonia xyli subsp. xyli str. CTCB07]|uniref:Uncharacterized protein n=2 Tax=Leifsonia xyli subsp. xyli TaxID=59736 RepID=Q6AHG0_LEIXX|nr:hypothetical protein Lxx01000 [Leifsonia xyli subsp. xyli str. CTCB07]
MAEDVLGRDLRRRGGPRRGRGRSPCCATREPVSSPLTRPLSEPRRAVPVERAESDILGIEHSGDSTMRFITPKEKAIVVAILVGVDLLLILLLDALNTQGGSIALSILQLVAWYLATRVFRGPGEPVRAARPWWRMTNRPLLSGVLGVGYGLLAVVNAGFSLAGYGSVSGVVSILVELVLAGLFLTSFWRLRALALLV